MRGLASFAACYPGPSLFADSGHRLQLYPASSHPLTVHSHRCSEPPKAHGGFDYGRESLQDMAELRARRLGCRGGGRSGGGSGGNRRRCRFRRLDENRNRQSEPIDRCVFFA